MKAALIWNEDEEKYHDISIPDTASTYEANLDTTVSCANCDKDIEFGESLTSRTIHNEVGFGYAVCAACYWDELKTM